MDNLSDELKASGKMSPHQDALDGIREAGVAIASDTAEFNLIGEYDPQDATTNPSLVYAAVSKPEYADIVDEAIQYAIVRRSAAEEQVDLAMDRLLVGVGIQIGKYAVGRVSVSVDPRLAYDRNAIVAKGRNLISIFEELDFPRERVLIKIPATYPGIVAARTLENLGPSDGGPIHANITLVFGIVQAIACAQAGISVISPFIGRVKDWWATRHPESQVASLPMTEHPGIVLVRRIRSTFNARQYATQIMAAGFRVVEEIVELGRGGPHIGPDIVTLPPHLLDDLRRRELDSSYRDAGVTEEPPHADVHLYVPETGSPTAEHEATYEQDLRTEMIALDKVPEGLAKFAVDARLLEEAVRRKITALHDEVDARL